MYRSNMRFLYKNTIAKNDKIIIEVYHDDDSKWGGWCHQANAKYIIFVLKDSISNSLVDIFVMDYPLLVKWWSTDECQKNYWDHRIRNRPTYKNGKFSHTSSFSIVKVDDIPKSIILSSIRMFDTSILFTEKNKLSNWMEGTANGST